MEFDKSKILTVATAEHFKDGQLGWANDRVNWLEAEVLNSEPYAVGESTDLVYRGDFPFISCDYTHRRYFYPAPEPTYAERQAEWVKQNNIKVGTKVRFTKDFNKDEDGSYCASHSWAKGKEGVVSAIHDEFIYVEMEPFDIWACPFTALEVIKEPTYRPYNSNELNDLVGEVLTNKQSGRRKLVTGKPAVGVNLDGSYITAKELLSSFYRNTNEPCGVMEEA